MSPHPSAPLAHPFPAQICSSKLSEQGLLRLLLTKVAQGFQTASFPLKETGSVPCLLHMEIFTCPALSYSPGKKCDSSRTLCQVLPSGQEPKLQMLGPGGFKCANSELCKQTKGNTFLSWAQAGETKPTGT